MPAHHEEYKVKEIEEVLAFIVEIEKLKSVLRKTKPVGINRFENSAEHSWHVCLSALILKDYANEEVDIDRVIRMLLIHDLGEIDVGDTIIYESETEQAEYDEEAGLCRILNLLPKHRTKEYLELWREFERGESPDAKYAKAIDRVPPLLHNLHGDGHSWRKYNITPKKVLSVNNCIENGSVELWRTLKGKINNVIIDGKFKDSFNK